MEETLWTCKWFISDSIWRTMLLRNKTLARHVSRSQLSERCIFYALRYKEGAAAAALPTRHKQPKVTETTISAEYAPASSSLATSPFSHFSVFTSHTYESVELTCHHRSRLVEGKKTSPTFTAGEAFNVTAGKISLRIVTIITSSSWMAANLAWCFWTNG